MIGYPTHPLLVSLSESCFLLKLPEIAGIPKFQRNAVDHIKLVIHTIVSSIYLFIYLSIYIYIPIVSRL